MSQTMNQTEILDRVIDRDRFHFRRHGTFDFIAEVALVLENTVENVAFVDNPYDMTFVIHNGELGRDMRSRRSPRRSRFKKP